MQIGGPDENAVGVFRTFGITEGRQAKFDIETQTGGPDENAVGVFPSLKFFWNRPFQIVCNRMQRRRHISGGNI